MDSAGYQRYCDRVAKARRWERVGVLLGAVLVGGWFLICIAPSSNEAETGTTVPGAEVSPPQQATTALNNPNGDRPTSEPDAASLSTTTLPNTTAAPQLVNPLPNPPVVSGPDPFLAIPSESDANYYTWTRASDGYVVQAKVLSVEEGRVNFRLRNGTTFDMPFNLLAKQDQLSAVQEAQKRRRGE